MAAVFEALPHWRTSGDQERPLRVALYESLRDGGVEPGALADLANRVLDVARRRA